MMNKPSLLIEGVLQPAHASANGLLRTVWPSNRDGGRAVATRPNTENVSINRPAARARYRPFFCAKQSGASVESGVGNLTGCVRFHGIGARAAEISR